MEFIVNLGLCNDKLACGLKFGQGILTTVEELIAYTLATLRYQWQDFNDCTIVADFGIWIFDSFVSYNHLEQFSANISNLVNNGLNV